MAGCEVCGSEEARYVCSNCSKRVGLLCFSKEGWLCTTCAKLEPQPDSEASIPTGKMSPMMLLLFAFIMILAGYALLAISAGSNGQGGGFVVIFPFFFATSGGSGFLFVAALILIILMLFWAYLGIRRPVRDR